MIFEVYCRYGDTEFTPYLARSGQVLQRLPKLPQIHDRGPMAGRRGQMSQVRFRSCLLSGEGTGLQVLRRSQEPQVLAQGGNHLRGFPYQSGEMAPRRMAFVGVQERD